MTDPKELIGLEASFDLDGKRPVGIITAAEKAEPYGPGKIPDFLVTVRGQSGRELKVSMVHTYMTLKYPDER